MSSENSNKNSSKSKVKKSSKNGGIFRRYLLSGLLVWVPIWVTLLVIHFLVDLMDKTLLLIPVRYRPTEIYGHHIPGLGIIFTLVLLFITGVIAANFLGKHVVRLWDSIMARIPLVRSIYSSVKKVLETVFSTSNHSFRKVLLVEYPRKGLWSIAFQTGDGCNEVNSKVDSQMATIFIPTTPNPTSGFLMMVAKNEVQELDMSVEEALRLVISLGVVQPELDGVKRTRQLVKV